MTQPLDKVRSLQEKLYVAAKANPTRVSEAETGPGEVSGLHQRVPAKEIGLACIVGQGSVRYARPIAAA